MAGTKVVLKDFPKGWCAEGKELLLVSLQAQLQVFGPLQGEPWIAPNLSHAEVTFKDPKDAQEAIEVLHGVDFREPEELVAETGSNYNGLQVALKQGGNKRGGGWVDKGQQPPKKEAKTEKPVLGSLGGGLGGGPAAEGLAALAGAWCVHYDAGGGNEMNYTINEEGEVKVGKKRWLQLVPAGSASDTKQDPNYAGTYFLNNAHREDTWEYVWMEAGMLRVHHFTTEDNGVSPYGSPNFWGTGTGQPADQVQTQPEPKMQQQPQQFGGKKGGGKWHKASAAMAGLEGVWTVVYQGDPNLEAGMTYTITASGEVTVGKKRHLQLVPAGSPMDARRDRNYAFDGVFLLDNAHREDTWEYVWMEMGQLCIHHFTDHDKGVSPFGSRHFWGMGMGMQGSLQDLFAPMMGGKGGGGAGFGGPGPAKSAPGVSYWRQGQSGKPKTATKSAGWDSSNGNGWKMSGAAGGGAVSAPPGQPVGPFEGTWTIEYEPGGGGMTYIISETGEVKVGKKRRAQLVPAQSEWDVKQDANYAGTYFLNEPHREDTWEYMWIEGDTIQVHHFTSDDTGTSPLGSSNYFGPGVGTKKE